MLYVIYLYKHLHKRKKDTREGQLLLILPNVSETYYLFFMA